MNGTAETPLALAEGNDSVSMEDMLNWENITSHQSTLLPKNDTPIDVESAYIPYELRPETYIAPPVFVLIFLVGLVGNGTLVCIFLKNRSMRSIPNTYIMSLAIGDFLVIVGTVPFISTIYTFNSWPYGTFICKLSEFLRDVSSGVTVLTLTLLSVDRYVAIVLPLYKLTGANGQTFTLALTGVIWTIAVGVALPGATYSFLLKVSLPSNQVIYVCYPFPENMFPWYPQTMIMAKFVLLYALPLVLIATFYFLMARHLFMSSRETVGANRSHKKKMQARTKVAKVVFAFVIIFALCFFPNHVFLIWFYFYPNAPANYSHFWHAWKIMGYILTFMNSCLNPIALYFISGKFRHQYRKQLLFCCKSPTDRRNNISFMALTTVSMKSVGRSTIVSRT